jgi:hypothetical protein
MDDAIQCLARIGLDGRVRDLGHVVKGASIFSPSGFDWSIPGPSLP